MVKKILISLVHGGEYSSVKLNFDDATVEAITTAAIELIQRHRLREGDALTVRTVMSEE